MAVAHADPLPNAPALWREALPWPRASDHKYSRGLALVFGGEMPGAAMLASRAARRIGAGMVIVAAPERDRALYLADQPGLVLRAAAAEGDRLALLSEPRLRVLLIGSGFSPCRQTRDLVLAALAARKSAVIDGGALTAFAERPDELFAALPPASLLTPHEGEFAALFPDLDSSRPRVERARRAAARANAVIVLKGSDTVIAAPGGEAILNRAAPADLATAGSGDVLAGLILGLLAQNMPPAPAAAAAVWCHAEAARILGRGLIAEDLPEAIPAVLRRLASRNPDDA